MADTHLWEARAVSDMGALLDGPASIPFTGAADAEKGLGIFARNCASCHQIDGAGSVGLAPSIRNRDFLALASDRFIKWTINKGRPGTAMVARPDLNHEDLTHIIGYLRSLEIENPVEIEVDWLRKLPGDPEAGDALYGLYCASCHGEHGEGYISGGSGPGIGLPGFLNIASDDYIMNTLRHGRSGTPMKTFLGAKGLANLTEQDGTDIIAHLRTDPRRALEFAENAPVRDARPANAVDGEKLFRANCSSCHQIGGTGLPGLAPSVRNRDFLALASDNFIQATVAQGRPGTAMVPRPDLAGSALKHIITYLRALPVVNAPDFALNPGRKCEGNPENGEALFASFCASCHGANGEGYSEGGSGPGIGLAGFLSVASDDYIFQTIKHGRIGTPMMSFMGARGLANLSESEVNDIIVYLRILENNVELASVRAVPE